MKITNIYRLNENLSTGAVNEQTEAVNLRDPSKPGLYRNDNTNVTDQWVPWVHPQTSDSLYAMNFVKSNKDRVELPVAGTLGIGETGQHHDYSISFWTKLTSASTNQVLLSIVEDDGNPNRLWIVQPGSGASENKILVKTGKTTGGFIVVAGTIDALALDEWIHIAMTYSFTPDDGTYSLYLNGVSQVGQTKQDIRSLDATDLVTIGCDLNSDSDGDGDLNLGYRFDGHMADVCIWDKMITQSEVIRNFENGLTTKLSRMRLTYQTPTSGSIG